MLKNLIYQRHLILFLIDITSEHNNVNLIVQGIRNCYKRFGLSGSENGAGGVSERRFCPRSNKRCAIKLIMDKKTLNTIIPILAVVIFFIWGWIEGSFKHSWIIFMVGGMLMGVLKMIDKEKEKQKEQDKAENK